MSAVDSAKQTMSSGAKTVKHMVRNTSQFVKELTLKQAVFIATGVLLVIVIFSNLLVGFWQKYLPSMLITLVKFQMYVLLPLTGIGGTVFGMYLEARYEKFYDLNEQFWDRIAQAKSGVKDVRRKME